MRRSEGWQKTQENLLPLRLRAADGKMRQTECADTKTLLRIIQSVPSPKAEPVKQWLARVGAERLETVTCPLDATQASQDVAAVPKPAPDAPALLWAKYHEQLATLFYRQAAYEEQLHVIEATLTEHTEQLGELHSRVESLEAGQRLLPEILERLGPERLSPEHQRTVQNAVKRLHEVGGYAYASVYAELGQHFHVARYDQIPEARWDEVLAWLRARIEAAEKRRGR